MNEQMINFDDIISLPKVAGATPQLYVPAPYQAPHILNTGMLATTLAALQPTTGLLNSSSAGVYSSGGVKPVQTLGNVTVSAQSNTTLWLFIAGIGISLFLYSSK